MSARTVRIALLDPCRFQKEHHYDEANIEAIAADLTEGSKAILNPVHVIPKGGGRWEVIAGHDRMEAAKRAGFDTVPARDFGSTVLTAEQVYEHWRMDNVLRKQPDRTVAARETLLQWKGEWSDRRVAVCCGVSHTKVAMIRGELEEAGQLATVASRKGRDERTRATPKGGNGLGKNRGRSIGNATRQDTEADNLGDGGTPAATPAPHNAQPTPTVAGWKPELPKAPAERSDSGAQKAPESDKGSTYRTEIPSVEADRSVAPSEPGAPGGAVVPSGAQEGTPGIDPAGNSLPDGELDPVHKIDAPPETAAVVEEEPEDVEAAACWDVVVSLPPRAVALATAPEIMRRVGLLMSAEDLAGIKSFHRALGTFLLQAEIARKEAAKTTTGAAA